MSKTFTLQSVGDPMSELNIQRRIKFLRLQDKESDSEGVSYIPESWVKADPALQWGVKNLDWLKIEKPQE
jgi:hypothetical protein